MILKADWHRLGTAGCVVLLGLAAVPADTKAQSRVPEARKITNMESSYPHWSPDGNRLVFQSNRNGNSDIYLSDADGSNLRRLTDHPAEDLTPAWSPDGRSIVFQSTRDGPEQLYLVNVDGSGLRRLTNHRANDGHPKWSPDGRSIIFNSNRGADSTNEEIYEMDLGSGDVRRLTTYSEWDTYASIAPNGNDIVLRRVTGTPGFDGSLRLTARNSEIFIARRDGSGTTNISNSVAFDGWPSWSPDSEWIAFSSNRTAEFHVYVMRRDGSDVRQLTRGTGSFTKPIWSPDGRRIVCTRTLDGNVEIFVLDL